MGHQFNQPSAYSEQIAPSAGGWEEQRSQGDSTSQHQPMDTDVPANSQDADGVLSPESKSEEATEKEGLDNGQDGDLPPENNLKENTDIEKENLENGQDGENNLKESTDMDGDRGAPLEINSIDENKIE